MFSQETQCWRCQRVCLYDDYDFVERDARRERHAAHEVRCAEAADATATTGKFHRSRGAIIGSYPFKSFSIIYAEPRSQEKQRYKDIDLKRWHDIGPHHGVECPQ